MLELDRLTRRFGPVVALDELSFTVPEATVVGFLGPNGSGKTTAMRTILGISVPDTGEVRWHGRRVGEAERRAMGYIPEERGLYPGMAVRDQLVFLARLHGMASAAARTATDDWLQRLGLADRANDKLETLSLGNQQRVQLAAAFVHRPQLLVLDEPFSGLDPIGIDALSRVLHEYAAAGASVLFSSHQLDLVEHICESVAIIDHGRLVASGAVDELATAGPPRLVVEVDGDPEGRWARRVRSVKVLSRADGRVRLRLGPRSDPQTVLRAAQRAGAVRHFSVERRRLSEVFLEAVGRQVDTTDAADAAGDRTV